MSQSKENLVAVDIGNSRIKLGLFAIGDECMQQRSSRSALAIVPAELPEPLAELALPLKDRSGAFEKEGLRTWCEEFLPEGGGWTIGSVHRGATEELKNAIRELAASGIRHGTIRQLTHRDLPIAVEVAEPGRVGIDRLLAAVGADRLRDRDRCAIVVDSGSATTVDLLRADGTFSGGAIFPGTGMSARALHEQTDALPLIRLPESNEAPPPLGKTTADAVAAGLFWGAVGAIRELAHRLSAGLDLPPQLFLTGGASPSVAKVLGEGESWTIHHTPHLVLGAIAVVESRCGGR